MGLLVLGNDIDIISLTAADICEAIDVLLP